MTTAADSVAVEAERALKLAELARLVKVRQRYERMAEAATAAITDVLIASHGNPSNGGLTYREMAEVVGLSRARIIQLVKGES